MASENNSADSSAAPKKPRKPAASSTAKKPKPAAKQAVPESASATEFVATPEAKKKATTFRLIAIALWVLAIAVECFAIFWALRQVPVSMVLLIVLLVVDAILAIAGSMLWKKSNRLDPASEKDKLRFFVQNQLGAIISIVAFLPLIILIFLNGNMSKTQKTIAGVVGVVLLLGTTAAGADLHPVSQEKYTAEINGAQQLMGPDWDGKVYWTPSGTVYHLYSDCPHIKGHEQETGTINEAYTSKRMVRPCKDCAERAAAEHGTTVPTDVDYGEDSGGTSDQPTDSPS